MIHAYLIALNLESDENNYHCKEFERIRKEINARANLNITVSSNHHQQHNQQLIGRD